MSDLWLKIKAWTKGVIAGAVLLYVILFLMFNSGQEDITFWYWFKHSPKKSPLFIEFFAFVSGVILTLMTMTLLRTLRQIRQTRAANRTERLERDVADMKAKAAMLQTKSPDGSGLTVKVDSLGGA